MFDLARDLAPGPASVFTRQQATDWFAERYPKIKPATVAAHLIRMSVNAPSRRHLNAKPGEDDLFYKIDGHRYRRFRPDADPIGPSPGPAAEPAPSEDEPPEPSSDATRFAYEADLRDYLARNLGLIEAGLRLYVDEDVTGVEFPAGGRYIDILALDARGGFVVVELKVSRGYDRVVGQLQRYMAWVKRDLADPGQGVRGVIVARQISEDLRLACSIAPGVELFEYELQLTLKRIEA